MEHEQPVYLDYNASTPIAPSVAAAMQPFLNQHFGNPSSSHWAGKPARDSIEIARHEIASLLKCNREEIVFTSGGSEANNQAIKGVFFGSATPPHIIISAVEHPAVTEPCRVMARLGATITKIPVDRYGLVDPDDVRRAIRSDTALISVMHANNEVGTIQPIAAIAEIAREHGVLCHTDAAQSVGKIQTSVDALGVDLLSLAGHKLYAPKGVGVLFVRHGVTLTSLIHGGNHESGQRAGTESALLAVGLGAACHLAVTEPYLEQVLGLRDRLWHGLKHHLGSRVQLNGHPTERLPNTLNISFQGLIAGELLAQVPSVAASTGSACHAGLPSASPVLAAMGLPPNQGLGAVRFSLGRNTTEDEIDTVVRKIVNCVTDTATPSA